MGRPRLGFTMVEMVVAILIGSILTSIALSSYSNARGRFAVRGARNTFVAVHARARAQAIEKGEIVKIVVSPLYDRLSLVTQSGDTLERIGFGDEFSVDIQRVGGSSTELEICMNSRGFAEESCNSFTTPAGIQFWQGADSASVEVLPLGQLIY